MGPTAVGGEQPFRTAYAADLSEAKVGERVRLAGWVARRRDQGGVYFFDLRDASGLVQVLIDPGDVPDARDLRMEFCITVEGTVQLRPEGMENPDMATGRVELAADQLEVLSRSEPLPFIIDDRAEADERLRLEYRYLDLRRPRMANNLRARSLAAAEMRSVLHERGFLEVETPTLIRSTPEGARDMLVPSRLRRGDFYALPQSPQLFKQLLMVGGVDRYYQIARCYRDEDFRSDRQLEFTQLDVEGAFWGREGVFDTFEAVVQAVVKRLRGITLDVPFARLTYAEALLRYGTDKPDARFGMEISDLSVVFAHTEFRAFSATLEAGGVIRALNAGQQDMSRSQLDGLATRAKELGAKGLVSAVVEDGGTLRSPTAKFLSEAETAGVIEQLSGQPGDLLLLVADTAPIAAHVLGQLRLQLGKPAGHDELNFLWVIDFPVFDEVEGGGLAPSHHPFTAPVDLTEMPRTTSHGDCQGIRPRSERQRTRFRLGPDPRPRCSARGIRDTRHLRGRSRAAVRMVRQGVAIWDTPACRLRARGGPLPGDPATGNEHSRCHSLPQDPDGSRSDDRITHCGRCDAIGRTGHRTARRP